MSVKNSKTTTYSLEWDVVKNLEARLLKDYLSNTSLDKARELLIIAIGSRLGLRVVDNLSLKWEDLMNLEIGEKFIKIEKKTNKERILVMSNQLKQIIKVVVNVLNPNPNHYIFTSQKTKGLKPMTTQNFNLVLKKILKEYSIKTIGNTSSHLLRKSFIVSAIRKGFQAGDHLALVRVSRLIGHSNITTTMRYTNFETNSMLSLYDLS